MTEVKNFHNLVNSIKTDMGKTLEALDWRADSGARQSRDELLALDGTLSLDPDSPPQILRVSVDETEYISIRRIEGRQLYVTHDEPGNSFDSKTIFGVHASSLPDGTIGVLLVPESAGCKNPSILEKFPEEEVHWSYFEEAILEGITYDPKDWKIDFGRKILVRRSGNNFYILDKDKYDKYDHRPIVRKLGVKDNAISLYDARMYLSEQEMEIKRGWYDSRARFYVLHKGSSEGEGARQSKPILKIVESTV